MYNIFIESDRSCPPYIEDLFRKAVVIPNSGEHRPSAGDWIEAIDRYYSELEGSGTQ